MVGMGLCCQRSSKNKENQHPKHRWPNGSKPPPLLHTEKSEDSSEGRRVSTDDSHEDFELLHSPRYLDEPPSNAFLQVSSILGSRKSSRGSSSGRSSLASVVSVQSADRCRRVSSYTQDEKTCEGEVLRPRRAVSLRLPSRHRRAHDSDSRLPTIYINDPPPHRPRRRKSSLQRALSLLTVSSAASTGSVEAKPVKKILRQPTRRRHVRGISGLPIAAENTSALSRSRTLYYPTQAPPRTRRTSAFDS